MVFCIFVSAMGNQQANQAGMSICRSFVQCKTCVHGLSLEAVVEEYLEYIGLTGMQRPVEGTVFAGRIGPGLQ